MKYRTAETAYAAATFHLEIQHYSTLIGAVASGLVGFLIFLETAILLSFKGGESKALLIVIVVGFAILDQHHYRVSLTHTIQHTSSF